MAEVHYYDPWDFCGDAAGTLFIIGELIINSMVPFPPGDRRSYVNQQFAKMKTNFVNKGIPVILGEYGVIKKTYINGRCINSSHLDSRAYYLKYVTQLAKNNGLVPFYWDNGGLGDKGFGIFNRNTNSAGDPKALSGLMQGATAGVYPY